MKKVIDQSKRIFNLRLKCIYNEKGCTEIVNASQLSTHQGLCPFQLFYCPNEGCNAQNLLLKDKLIHEESCLFQPIQCFDCKTPILRNELHSHLKNECFSNNFSCIECQKEINKNDCVKHHEDYHKKVEKCEKCLGLTLSNHDCIHEMCNQIYSSKRKASLDLKEVLDKNDELKKGLSTIKQSFEELKSSVEKNISNITISVNTNIQNLTNLITNFYKEIQQLNFYIQNMDHKFEESAFNLKSQQDLEENKVHNEIQQLNEDINKKIEDFNKDNLNLINESILKFNSENEKKSEMNEKRIEEIYEKIKYQEIKIKELYQDLDRFKESSKQDFNQKIESVGNDSLAQLKELKENSLQVSDNIDKIRGIFQPLSETNIKRLKQSMKKICTLKYIDEEYYSSPESKEKNKYLFYVERKTENEKDILHVNNLELKKEFKIELYKNNNYMNDAVYHNGMIFYCGGGLSNNNFLDSCSIVNIENQNLNLSCRLNEKKCFVSLVSCIKSVFCIGGYNGYSLNDCEIFNSENKEWCKAAKLNKAQDRITSFFNPPSSIFTFGSTDQNVIEKLEIYSGVLAWELLKIKCPTRGYGCAIAISNRKILLFGGESSGQEFYVFNPLENTLKMQKERFCESTSFHSSKPIYFNGFIIAISESDKKKFLISPEDYKYEVNPLEF